jgi:hypothetical protein
VNARVDISVDVRPPHTLRDVLARDELARAVQQHQEDIHRLAREPDPVAIPAQLVGTHVELELPELVSHVGRFYCDQDKFKIVSRSCRSRAAMSSNTIRALVRANVEDTS